MVATPSIRRWVGWLGVAVGLAAALPLRAATQVLQPEADARVYQGEPTANYNKQQLMVGTVRLDRPSCQASLLRFDVSRVKGPIKQAVLTLFTGPDAQMGMGRGMMVEAHRITLDWDPPTVSFAERQKGEPWKTPGGDFDPEPVVTVTHKPTIQTGTPVAFEITALVQDWVNKTAPNHGVILLAPGYPQTPTKGELQSFDSSENFLKMGEEFTPRLTVITDN